MITQQGDSLSQIVGAIAIVLRYTASGFIGVVAYCFLNYSDFFIYMVWDIDILFWVLLAAAIGVLAYAIHIAWWDNNFYRSSLSEIVDRNYHESDNIKKARKQVEKLTGKSSVKDKRKKNVFMKIFDFLKGIFIKKKSEDKIKVLKSLYFALTTQRYLRKISTEAKIERLEVQLEQKYALLSFLYTSIYQLVTVLVYTLFKRLNDAHFKQWIYWFDWVDWIIIVAIAGVLRLSAIRFDYRITKREIWAVNEFYQTPQKIGKVEDNLPMMSIKINSKEIEINTK